MIKDYHNQIVQLRNQGLTCAKIISELNLNCTKSRLQHYIADNKIYKNSIKNDTSTSIKKYAKNNVKNSTKTTKLPFAIVQNSYNEFTKSAASLTQIAELFGLKRPNLSLTIHGKRNVVSEISALESVYRMSIGEMREIYRNERGLVV